MIRKRFSDLFHRVILLGAALLTVVEGSKFCDRDHGCWFIPSGCETETTNSSCSVRIQWRLDNLMVLRLKINAKMIDLNDTSQAIYVALGFSRDLRMLTNIPDARRNETFGVPNLSLRKFSPQLPKLWFLGKAKQETRATLQGEDTVFDCIANQEDGEGRAFISYNDDLHNSQLMQATEKLVIDSFIAMVDGEMSCRISVDLKRLNQVVTAERWKIGNLSDGNWSLQLARGYADPWRLTKKKHPLDDGTLYPWTTTEMVSLTDRKRVTLMTQSVTGLSRSISYLFVTVHAILLLWTWWFLIAVAILTARFAKPIFPTARIFGNAIWFQIHRNFMVFSVFLQIIGIFLVLWQSGFLFYVYCSNECTVEQFSKPTHTITGLIAFSLTLFQPFLAWARPSTLGRHRPVFNFVHWFIGMTAFICACVCIISAIPLGKTALARNFKKLPNFLMGAYIATFMLISIALEGVRSKSRKMPIRNADESGASLLFLSGPSYEMPVMDDMNPKSRISCIVLFTFVAIAINSCFTYMIWFNYMQKH